MAEPLEVLRQQIIDNENFGPPVSAEEVSQIFQLSLGERTFTNYLQIYRFLRNCPLFVTIQNAKVIGESSIVELIK